MCRSKVNRLHRRGLIILVIIPSQYSTPLSPTTPDIVCSPRYCTLSNASIPNGVSLQDNSELHVKSLDVVPVRHFTMVRGPMDYSGTVSIKLAAA
jgi:hypothetical protein